MFFRWLGYRVIRHRIPILAAFVGITIVAGLLALDLRFDFRPESMLEFSEEEEHYAKDFQKRFQTDENALLVVIHGKQGSVLTKEGLTILYTLTEKLAEPAAVESTYSIVSVPRKAFTSGISSLLDGGLPPPLVEGLPLRDDDVQRVREAVASSQILPGNLISHDGSTAMVVISLQPDYVDPIDLDPLLEKFEKWVPEIVSAHSDFAEDGPAFEAHFGGLPYVRTETIRHLKREQLIFWPMVGIIYFVLLLLIFRRPLQSLLPLIAVGFATVWSVGLMAALGQEVNVINNVLPTLILVVGVCNAIHVMIRIIDKRRLGLSPLEAVSQGVANIGLPSLLTTLTTAIGFGALVVAHAKILRDFGLLIAGSIMLTYISIIVVLPILTSFIKLRIAHNYEAAGREGSPALILEKLGDKIALQLMRRPWLVLVASVAVLGGCIYMGTRVPMDARVIETFEDGHPIVRTNTLIEEKLGGILPLEIDLTSEPNAFGTAQTLQRLESFEQRVNQIDGVLSTLSLTDILAEGGFFGDSGPTNDIAVAAGIKVLRRFQPGALERYTNNDLSNTRICVRLPDKGIQHNLEIIDKVDALAEATFRAGSANPRIDYRLTGTAYLSATGLETFVRDLFYSLLTATAVIFIVLIVMFRSIRVGILSLLPNLMPLAATLALMPLFGYELNTTTVVVFTISIGLAVDNCIHLIARFREELAKNPVLDDAIRKTFKSAGRAIIMSNLLLAGGFSILVFSNFEPIRRVGLLTMTTILIALVSSLVVLPAEFKLFGRVLGGKQTSANKS